MAGSFKSVFSLEAPARHCGHGTAYRLALPREARQGIRMSTAKWCRLEYKLHLGTSIFCEPRSSRASSTRSRSVHRVLTQYPQYPQYSHTTHSTQSTHTVPQPREQFALQVGASSTHSVTALSTDRFTAGGSAPLRCPFQQCPSAARLAQSLKLFQLLLRTNRLVRYVGRLDAAAITHSIGCHE